MKSAWQARMELETLIELAKDGMSVPSPGCGQGKRCKNNMQVILKEINSAIARGDCSVYISAGQLKFRKHIIRGEQVGILLRRLARLGYGWSFHAGANYRGPVIRVYWKTQV